MSLFYMAMMTEAEYDPDDDRDDPDLDDDYVTDDLDDPADYWAVEGGERVAHPTGFEDMGFVEALDPYPLADIDPEYFREFFDDYLAAASSGDPVVLRRMGCPVRLSEMDPDIPF